MNWKRFKNLFGSESHDESHFILGIDLGSDSSALAFFDGNQRTPELIDLSGGYGKPSIPTVVQYVTETKEWVFGEYAVLNSGFNHITLQSFIDRLGRKEYVEIDNKSVPLTHILSLFLKELVQNIKNINPKAEIAGIVTSIPSYMGEEAKKELLLAFKSAGYEKELIEFTTERDCVFTHYYYGMKPRKENILLLDYGSRQLRGSLYRAEPKARGVGLQCLSSFFIDELGIQAIDEDVSSLFDRYYMEETKSESIDAQTRTQLSAFVYQHKDLLFQKNSLLKPIKLYFNFAYPPFQRSVSKQELEDFLEPLRGRMRSFLSLLLSQGDNLAAGDVDTVLCTGGGFEMHWVRNEIDDMFPDSQVRYYKNTKGVVAEGASIVAASRLGFTDSLILDIEDRHMLQSDLGLMITKGQKESFFPLVERNSFWWQKHTARSFIINTDTAGTQELEIFKRNYLGELTLLGKLPLTGLPPRPKGATRINIKMEFQSPDEMIAIIEDKGFGELFPSQGFRLEYELSP